MFKCKKEFRNIKCGLIFESHLVHQHNGMYIVEHNKKQHMIHSNLFWTHFTVIDDTNAMKEIKSYLSTNLVEQNEIDERNDQELIKLYYAIKNQKGEL